jgi:hypothetical protein
MIRLLIILAVTIWLSLTASNVSAQTECPPDKVCLTIEQARQALIDSDTVKAQQVEIKAQKDAIELYKAEIANLRIELAKMTGDKTGAEQMIVRLTAIVDFMLKNGRTKKYGLINF